MSKRPFIALVGLLLILAVVLWATNRKTENKTEALAPLLSVYAYNQTKSLPATQIAASPNDVVAYTLTAENQTDQVVSGFVITANISQVTDKSTLINANGAAYNSADNSLIWTPLDIPAYGVIQKQFIVRVNPIGASDTNTVMRIKFNNQIVVAVQSTTSRQSVAGAVIINGSSNDSYKAPVTGPAASAGVWLALLATGLLAGIKRNRSVKV